MQRQSPSRVKMRAIDLEQLRDRLLATEHKEGTNYSARTVVLALAVLSKMYEWARTSGELNVSNPVSDVERPSIAEAKEHLEYLSVEQATALLSTAEETRPEIAPMVATALYTGMRRGELFGLRWQDVRFEVGQIDVMRSYLLAPKSGKSRHLPINPELGRILREWKKRCPQTAEDLVFPVHGHMGRRDDELGLRHVYAQAGFRVPRAPWHCLRHTFASNAVMSGLASSTCRSFSATLRWSSPPRSMLTSHRTTSHHRWQS